MSHLLIAIALLAASNAERDSVEFTKDSLKVVKQNVDDGKAVMVDVRSQEEWDQGHLDDSLFLPVTMIRKGKYPAAATKTVPKDKVVYTFCVVGMRAKRAAIALGKEGYEVRALKPGYDKLLEAGFKKAETKKSGDENTR
jgi:rhodanese-related sulfurtransferase